MNGAEVPRELETLLARARALVGVTLGELADDMGLPVPLERVRSKGWSGRVIERELGAADGGHGVDFASIGLELKTVPTDEALRPLESTWVCHIDPVQVAGESWTSSYVRRKLERVLFVALQVPAAARSREPESSRPPELRSRPTVAEPESSRVRSLRSRPTVADRRVSAACLWTPAPDEEAALRADFELFARDYFRRGRADEITGRQGAVMQVRPKGRNAADTRAAYGPDGRPVRVGRMGFYLRPAFVGRILHAWAAQPGNEILRGLVPRLL